MKKKVLKKQNNSRNCFVCGVMNDMGLKSAFYELEDGTVAALVEPKPEHQSYPMRVHGGVISAMLDETIGRAINIKEPDTWAVTGELTVRFKKPVPYGEQLLVTGRITRNTRLIFDGEGEIYSADGTLCATGRGRYVKQPLDVIGGLESHGDFWRCFPSEDDPKEIDVPEK